MMKKVLVVDDEQMITDGLVSLFALESIEADGAYDRTQAEQLLSSEFYPVILADWRLKNEEDGLKLLENIRRLSPRSRVASFTGFATPELDDRLRSLGSTVILHKPMAFDEIVATVREMLEEIELELESHEFSDPLDLDDLYERVRPILYAIPQRRYGFMGDDAEDLVQEAWCLFLEKQDTVRAPKPWLAGTVSNLCRQRIHEHVRARSVETEIEDRTADDASWHASFESMMLRDALGRVDERSRQLCTLIGIEGCSYEEVSEEMAIPIGSIGPLYIRAKQKLRNAVEAVN